MNRKPLNQDHTAVSAADIKKNKRIAVELLAKLKSEKLRIDHWRDQENTRDAVLVAIRNHLYDDKTGLPLDSYTEEDVELKTGEVFRHICWAYPTIPSPFYYQ